MTLTALQCQTFEVTAVPSVTFYVSSRFNVFFVCFVFVCFWVCVWVGGGGGRRGGGGGGWWVGRRDVIPFYN